MDRIISIPALQLAPKLFCVHLQLQCNAGKDTMLAQVYIVNQPLRDYYASEHRCTACHRKTLVTFKILYFARQFHKEVSSLASVTNSYRRTCRCETDDLTAVFIC